MRRRLLAFVGSLRANGLAISVAETMDALAAVGQAGVEREALRDALATTLVKDERDRPVFDPLFDAAFPLRRAPRERAAGRRGGAGGGASPGRRAGGGASGAAAAHQAGQGDGEGDGHGSVEASPSARPGGADVPRSGRDGSEPGCAEPGAAGRDGTPDARRGADAARGHAEADATRDDAESEGHAGATPRDAAARGRGDADGLGTTSLAAARRARTQALLTQPFGAWTGDDLVEARAVVAELARNLRARLARRERAARRGRPDLRRTLRAAAATGGVPLAIRRRTRRPNRPDLLLLCDVSGSVATPSTLCLGLVAPATPYFRRVDCFAFVDHLCPVSVEDGHVVPAGPLDLWARSDMGQVLAELWRDQQAMLGRTTVVLVVGDARNNRRPPRADLLRAVRERVQRLVWLVPEPRARWNTGDSVLGRYAEHCDAVVECTDLAGLAAAVRRVL